MRNEIVIPELLYRKVADDPQLMAIVTGSVSNAQQTLQLNHTPLFQDYSDHSIRHFGEVMQSIEFVLSPKTRGALTAGDAAVLVLSSILHDIAMHLTEAGFLRMLSSPQPSLIENDTHSWPALWREFVAEASRWSDSRLQSMFGTKEYQPPQNMSDDPGVWTRYDRMYAGEFIRRHHPRLAHEIAVNGFPAPEGYIQVVPTNSDGDILDIVGLVSRSHGHSLRFLLDRVNAKYHLKEYRAIHIPFCMAALRIADYIQLHSARAPTKSAQIRRILSPFSEREWSAHKAVKNITFSNDDPELVFINAEPEDPTEYEKCRKLFGGLQSELDHSWALLGEVYGRQHNADSLELSIRRIRSNLDNPLAWSKSDQFIPSPKKFNASPDLLALLVGPLYGEDPLNGLRELLQNSADACRERATLGDEYEGSIEVQVSHGINQQLLLSIVDNGIGMSEHVISNYFLVAGSSYRSSSSWKKKFETIEGNSKVLRSGKFGIGVLASLLIGERITVLSRNVDEETGIEFSFKAPDDPIHLRKRHGLEFGTSVTVHNVHLASMLSHLADGSKVNFDEADLEKVANLIAKHIARTYSLRDPKVAVVGGGSRYEVKPDIETPNSPGDEGDWQYVRMEGYGIHWSWAPQARTRLGRLSPAKVFCNGALVGRFDWDTHRAKTLGNGILSELQVATPNVSFFDPDGKAPLSLDRTRVHLYSIEDWQGFRSSLCQAYFAAFIEGHLQKIVELTNRDQRDVRSVPVGRASEGWMLYRKVFLDKEGVSTVILLNTMADSIITGDVLKADEIAVWHPHYNGSNGLGSFDAATEGILDIARIRRGSRSRLRGYSRAAFGVGQARVALVLSDAGAKRLQERAAKPSYISERIIYEPVEGGLVLAFPDYLGELEKTRVRTLTDILQNGAATSQEDLIYGCFFFDAQVVSLSADETLMEHASGTTVLSYEKFSDKSLSDGYRRG